MKKFFYLLVFFIFACGNNSQEKIIIGINSSSFNSLPIQMAIQTNRFSNRNNIILKTFQNDNLLTKELEDNSLDLAVLPHTFAWKSFQNGEKIKILSGLERNACGIFAQKEIKNIQQLEKKKIGVVAGSVIHSLVLSMKNKINYEIAEFTDPIKLLQAIKNKKISAVAFYTPTIHLFREQFNIIHWFEDESIRYFPRSDLIVNTNSYNSKEKEITLFLKELKKSVAKYNSEPEIMKFSGKELYNVSFAVSQQSIYKTRYIMNLSEKDKEFEFNNFKRLYPDNKIKYNSDAYVVKNEK